MKLSTLIGIIAGVVFLSSCLPHNNRPAYTPDAAEIIKLKNNIDSNLIRNDFEVYISNQLILADIYKKSDSLASWLYCYDRIIKITRDNISLDSAIVYYKVVNDEIWRLPSDSASRNNLAWIHRQIAYEFGPKLQKWQTCIPYYIEGINLIDASDSWTADKAIKFLKPCGSAYTRLGEPQNAIGYLKKCYTICATAADTLNMLKSLNDLGVAYYDIAQYNAAFDTYTKAFALNKSGLYSEEYHGTLCKLITWHIDNKQSDSADFYLQLLSASFLHKITEPDDYGDYYLQLAKYYALNNQNKFAETNFNKAVQKFLESPENRTREAAKVNIELGNLLLQQQNYEKSIAAFHQALTLVIPNRNFTSEAALQDDWLFPENVIMEACCGKGDAFYHKYLLTKNVVDLSTAIHFYESALKTRGLLLDSYTLQSSKIKFEEKTQYLITRLASAKLISDNL